MTDAFRSVHDGPNLEVANTMGAYIRFQYDRYHWEDFEPRGYQVILLSKGYFAVVSKEDYKRVSKYNWYVNVQADPRTGDVVKVYAYRKSSAKERSRGAPTYIYLHRFLTGVVFAGRDVVVDHINCDTLDCRRRNLVVTGQSHNLGNMATTKRPVNIGTPRGAKPVKHKQQRTGKTVITGWRGRIKVRGKEYYSRTTFSTAERAGRWYVRVHRVYFPLGDGWRERSRVPKLRLPMTVDEYLAETIPF